MYRISLLGWVVGVESIMEPLQATVILSQGNTKPYHSE